jgi:4-hydroxy-tetrahydrodipicolinate synthase
MTNHQTVASRIRGSITALITPFRDGKVDEAAFRKLVNWQIEQGTNGLVPCGTTGESPTLSHEEHNRLITLCVEEARGRVPVIAGAGSNSTVEAIAFTKHAKDVGADAVLSVTGYYNKPSQEGQYRHFMAVADAVDIPIILYNIPPRAIVEISVETMARLAKHPFTRKACHRQGLDFAVGRRRHRAGLCRPWRPWLHLGHGQCRTEAVRRVPEAVPAGRL